MAISIRKASTRGRYSALLLAAGLGVLFAHGCGDDDGVAPVPPTPTPHPGPPHSLMRVGSTQPGGGNLTVNEIPTAFLVPTACLGGSGDDCAGGTVVYSGSSPGFNSPTGDDPALPLYVLPDGVEVRIELTAIDPDTSLLISGFTLNEVGESAAVNTTPELHNHPTWQFVAPGGAGHPEEHHMSFRLRANGFGDSAEIPITLEAFEGDGGNDDHHDDE